MVLMGAMIITKCGRMKMIKQIVDECNTAILYMVPRLKHESEVLTYQVKYANSYANTLFSESKENLVDKAIKELPKLCTFGDTISQIEKVIASNKQHLFAVETIIEDQSATMQVDIKTFDEGILLSVTAINTAIVSETKLKNKNLLSSVDEIEISNLFSTRVLDGFNTMICYLKPMFTANGKINDFSIEYINDKIIEISKDSKESILGMTYLERYPKNLKNRGLEVLIECYNSEKDKDFNIQYRLNDEDFWFSNRVIKINDGVLLFSKDVSREKEYEEQLFVENKLLTESESVAGIGSFRWNLAKPDVKYSDNVYRLFGYEPNEFESNYERFLSFVHNDDIEKVKKGFKDARDHKTRTDIVFKVYTKLNELKYLNAVGECFQKDANWYMVGVVRDVTGQIEIETNLQAKNAELKKSNSNLEAFNRVASHDLQEPLRKIQMFVSRLSDEEKDRMNSKSQGYLEKVKSSSDRMRNLINNLLYYSKVEEVEELPKDVDLNEVLENVLEDLGERIHDLNAEIKSDHLPMVNGVQFQLEQLFSNLIGNSLKYIKPNSTAKIKIKSSIVFNEWLPKEINKSNERFVKLQFIDNGIGFEKKYESKIFEIFQRLHGKTEYTGTGLGLSICKKIVESHNGAIRAKGVVNKGAEFIVYLPVLI